MLVFDDTVVAARECDPIDLDGNGMFDDNLFISNFGNDDAFLDDNGILYFVATVRDAGGSQQGHGLFTVDTNAL